MRAEDFPPEALDFILRHEGCANHPEFPGGASGITIGYGYDLGYHSSGQFSADWRPWLAPPDFVRLRSVLGFTGDDAHARVHALADVEIDDDAARAVFVNCSLPRAIRQTETAFPGADKLPQLAEAALVSLVFNRGASMGERNKPSWDTRREMRRIRDDVEGGNVADVPAQIRSMTRLWDGKGLDGLITRREDEAQMIEKAIA